MKNECEIVRDLLPLYAEGLTSASSNELIEEHIRTCNECRELLDSMKNELPPEAENEKKELPLKEFSKTFSRKKRELALMIAALAASAVIAVYAWLSAPRYLAYNQAVESTQEVADGLLVRFTDHVHHISTMTYTDPDSGLDEVDLECWTCDLDRLWKVEPVQETLLRGDKIWYRSNKDVMSGDVQLYGPDAGGSKTLKRLTLNYYFWLAAGMTLAGALAGFLLRNRKAGEVLRKSALIPLSWCLASIIVERGIRASTWSIARDFSLIVLLWICLSVFFLCLAQRLREKKAVRTEP